ncbi:Tetratricopeptide repeat protein [uncultured archaeon]|nr:Tetratricopeptide repeat protein [uncultured archaeon]
MFYSNFKAEYKPDKLVVESVFDMKFNCYSSTLLFADVCMREGKPVIFVLAPGHMFLRGKNYSLETTVDSPGDAVSTLAEMNAMYKGLSDAAIGKSVAIAHSQAGWRLQTTGRLFDAVMEFQKSILLFPEFDEPWCRMGECMLADGHPLPALKAIDMAVELNPHYGEAWHARSRALLALGLHKEATESVDRSLALERGKREYRETKKNILLAKRAEKSKKRGPEKSEAAS